MEGLFKRSSLFLTENLYKKSSRTISKYLDKNISAKTIRQRFLDYYINECNHNFVRSSPVVPFYDPSVAFVNSGMNQFKGIFLGAQVPQHRRVVNSQKCVRVGGKHNDLNVVGSDGYHHTFFEMLGNWSFGDYFKKDACEMAWNLLTEKYKIKAQILYVTYFNGDDTLGLEPDLECRDIWRSIGVPEDRILPYGVKHNFWEMGSTGPCGPCTEIHADLLGCINRSKFVNKGLLDLTELWNIVFIEYKRNTDGSIESLPQKHIDTGMGFERLTALLQGKISNYDTDIFSSIFSGIEKVCKGIPGYGGKFGEKDWNNLDTSYRILGDHIRMVVVCLGDGVIPEQNQKLRRIIRSAFLISETVFKKETGLLKELSNYVVENLGSVYPELEKNIKEIHQIIDYEEDVYRSIRKTSSLEWEKLIKTQPELSNLDVIEMPGLVAAYKEILSLNSTTMCSKLGFKLYDTFGLDEDTIVKLAHVLNLHFDVEGFRNELEMAKLRSRKQSNVSGDNKIIQHLIENNIKPTVDSYKYNYEKRNSFYEFPTVEVCLLKVFHNDVSVNSIKTDTEYVIILDKTNLYSEAGGQSSDKGLIKFGNDCVFHVHSLQNINGYILHKGILKSKKTNSKVLMNNKGTMEIDETRRLNNMRNHTATHLLNATLKQIKGVTCQKSSIVNPQYLNFDVGIFGSKLSKDDIEKVEEEISSLINQGNEVSVKMIDSGTLLSLNNVTLIPGETYPFSAIRLVEINGNKEFLSREPCCGTHVLNTSDIEDFCIIWQKSLGRSTTSLYAVTGERARLARNNGNKLMERIVLLEKDVNDNIDEPEVLDVAIANLKRNLKYDMEGSSILPVAVKHKCSEKLISIAKQIKHSARNALREFVEMEMRNVLETNKKFVVHYLACSTMLEKVSLQKATDVCQNLPVIVISYSDNVVTARCCVPEHSKNQNFNAEKWLASTVNVVFKSSCLTPKDQDASLVCNMKGKRINIRDWDTLLKQSMDVAKDYAEKNLI